MSPPADQRAFRQEALLQLHQAASVDLPVHLEWLRQALGEALSRNLAAPGAEDRDGAVDRAVESALAAFRARLESGRPRFMARYNWLESQRPQIIERLSQLARADDPEQRGCLEEEVVRALTDWAWRGGLANADLIPRIYRDAWVGYRRRSPTSEELRVPEHPLLRRIACNQASVLRTVRRGLGREHWELAEESLADVVGDLVGRCLYAPEQLDNYDLGWVVTCARRRTVRRITDEEPEGDLKDIDVAQPEAHTWVADALPLGDRLRTILGMRLARASYQAIAAELSTDNAPVEASRIFVQVQLLKKAFPEAGRVLNQVVEEPELPRQLDWWRHFLVSTYDVAALHDKDLDLITGRLCGVSYSELSDRDGRTPGTLKVRMHHLRRHVPWLEPLARPDGEQVLGGHGI